jgi:periplasmic copper chaperone A
VSRLPLRMPWPAAVAGVAVVVLGAAGLVRGAVPQSSGGGGGTSDSPPIVVTAAYVRPPVPPTQTAAAYFTIYNTTDKPDTLQSVQSGAGASSVVHAIVNGQMTVPPNGLVVPAHGTVVFATGTGHVMISQLFGKLTAGENVALQLDFANAGAVNVSAPVVPFGTAPPTGGSTASPPTSGATK